MHPRRLRWVRDEHPLRLRRSVVMEPRDGVGDCRAGRAGTPAPSLRHRQHGPGLARGRAGHRPRRRAGTKRARRHARRGGPDGGLRRTPRGVVRGRSPAEQGTRSLTQAERGLGRRGTLQVSDGAWAAVALEGGGGLGILAYFGRTTRFLMGAAIMATAASAILVVSGGAPVVTFGTTAIALAMLASLVGLSLIHI